MATVEQLLDANLHHVFNNRDDASRAKAAEHAYTDDVVFTDPEGTVTGRDAVIAKASELLSKTPESFAFEADSISYTGPDSGAMAWTFGPAGAPVVRGIGIITVRDGRISSIRTLVVEADASEG